tara:strand:+ start:324 stop:725 length:402 start_codon:yes stop_codon:yes gene_type:complete
MFINKYKYILLKLIFLNIYSITEQYKFRVCGSYCGPGWCNNMWLNENKCNTSVNPEFNKLFGFSCADSCCKNHDHCCGNNKTLQYNCNKEIISCLSNCDPFSITCTNNNIPILAGEIRLGMDIVEDWCCGEPC